MHFYTQQNVYIFACIDVNIKIFRMNQMCMPFLFMCRHTIELLIKAVLDKKQGEFKKIHRLKELWEN